MPTSPLTAAQPPPRPLLVFDGDCHFCRGWVARWQKTTGDRVDYAPLQEKAADFPEAPRAEFEREVKLIEPGGRITGGAEAVCRTLGYGGGLGSRTPLWIYQHLPLARLIADAGYAFVARNRTLASAVTRFLWRSEVPLRQAPPD